MSRVLRQEDNPQNCHHAVLLVNHTTAHLSLIKSDAGTHLSAVHYAGYASEGSEEEGRFTSERYFVLLKQGCVLCLVDLFAFKMVKQPEIPFWTFHPIRDGYETTSRDSHFFCRWFKKHIMKRSECLL